MIRQHLVEILIDLQRIGLVAGARQVAAVSLDHAHRGGVDLVSALIALAGVLLVVGKIEDEAGMQILEDRIPVRARQLVHGVGRGARIAGAGERPGRQERRGEIGHRAAHRLGKILPGGGIVLLLERANADDQMGDAVGVVDLQKPVSKLAGLIDVAAGEHGEKGAAEQIGIFRIGLQHVEVIGGGGGGIALGAGMAGGQIVAGRVVEQQLLLGGRGDCRRQAQQYGGANNSGAPGQQRIDHDSSIGKLGRRTGNQAPEASVDARMTFLPRPRKDAEEHQFVCNPQGLIRPLGRNGGEIAAGRDVIRGNASLWIYDCMILKPAGEINDGRLPSEPMRIA